MRVATAASLARIEFAMVATAVFLAPYSSFHHPALFFTLSDFVFSAALALRLLTGWPLRPLGAGTELWYLGLILLNYGLLVSSLIAGNIDRGWIVFAQYLFAYLCLPLMLCRSSYDEAVSLAKWCVYGMVVMCAFGIAAYLWGYNGGYQKQFAIVSGGGRLSAFVDNPNGLAGFIAFTLPLLWFLASTGAFRRLTSLALSVPLFVALVLTSSNTGLLSAILASGTFLIGLRRIKLLAIAVAAVGALAFSVQRWGQYFLPEVFQRRVLNAVTEGNISEAGTFADRYELMKEAWRLADTHLWLGMGADQYRVISEYGLPVHNTYLLLLNEGGLASLCGYLILLASALMAPYQARHTKHGAPIMLCATTIAITVAITAVSFVHVYNRFLAVPLLLAVGLAVAATARSPRSAARGGHGQEFRRRLTPA